MKFLTLTLLAILSTTLSWACGGGYYSEKDEYYPMFNQQLISNSDYLPFLYTTMSTFYPYGDNPEQEYTGNIMLWQESFPEWSKADFMELLYSDNYENIIQKHSSPIDQSIINYISFARSTQSKPKDYDELWSYDTYLNNKQTTTPLETINKAIELFRNEQNKALKQRYGYQVVKLLRYNRDYKGALYFFDTELESVFDNNEIYYYTLDQVGGCYYNLDDYNKALNVFIQVFTNSADRRHSAYLSYKFCLGYTNPVNILKEDDEVLNFYLLKSMSDFNDGVSILNAMKSIDYTSDKIEVVFSRNMSYLDRKIWNKYNSSDKNNPETKALVKAYMNFAGTMKAKTKQPYWIYAHAYLEGVIGNYKTAIRELNSITDQRFTEEKTRLTFLFNGLQWSSIADVNQGYFKEEFNLEMGYCDDEFHNPVHHYIKDEVIKKLYEQEHKPAQAYLVNQSIGNKLFDHVLIDDLIDFVNKPNKTPLELVLTQHIGDNPINELNFQKGNLYLFEGQFKQATQVFPKSPSASDIPKSVFSNAINICYDCPPEDVMTDSVYLADVFSFVPEQMNSKTLAETLLTLKTMTEEQSNWKGQLAYYLLGNFYINISNTGYYRSSLWNESNCCHYRQMETYLALAHKAKTYYEQVIEHSNNTELKARTTYLLAQCEQNISENESSYDSHYFVNEQAMNDVSQEYLEYFNTLSTTYRNTKFYDKAQKRCSYFRMYTQ